MQVTRGKVQTPIRAVAYGPEGWGKSTFAAAWPAPLFLDVEQSTQSMDVARLPRPISWAGMQSIVAELTTSQIGPYKTIVVDTADWAERLAKEAICARANVKAIGDVDYGRLYQQLATEWAQFLDSLTRMQRANGCHVLLLAHSCLAHVDIPEESGTVDRYEMKLTHSFKVDLSALTKEWATLVMHLGYETLVVKVDGTNKAQGGTKRVIHTTHHACWDAKQRPGYDLPDTIECVKDNPAAGVAKLWAAPATPAAQPPVASPPPAAQPEAAAGDDPERAALLAQIRDLLAQSGVTVAQLGAELARKGVVPADTPVEAYNLQTARRIVAGWSAIVSNIKNREKQA